MLLGVRFSGVVFVEWVLIRGTGLRMASFHGNFFVRSTDLLAMPAVPQDQSYAIEIQIEETITSPFVVFQTAVLHTTCYGSFTPLYLLFNSSHQDDTQVNAESELSPSHCPPLQSSRKSSPRPTRSPSRPSLPTRPSSAH